MGSGRLEGVGQKPDPSAVGEVFHAQDREMRLEPIDVIAGDPGASEGLHGALLAPADRLEASAKGVVLRRNAPCLDLDEV